MCKLINIQREISHMVHPIDKDERLSSVEQYLDIQIFMNTLHSINLDHLTHSFPKKLSLIFSNYLPSNLLSA